MKEMTTAEFAKANLAAIAEPVSIRRYTQVVGTYYPLGFEPAASPQLSLSDVEAVAPESVKATAKIVEELTDEVARLKRELAKRPSIEVKAAAPDTRKVSDDVFAGLAAQDRAFFERKLGTGKKK